MKVKRKRNNTMMDLLKSKRELDELIALSSELRSLITKADIKNAFKYAGKLFSLASLQSGQAP